MQTLFPIIRRVRRPLLVADAPPVVVGNVEPVNVEAEREVTSAEASRISVPTQTAEPVQSLDWIASRAAPIPIPKNPD